MIHCLGICTLELKYNSPAAKITNAKLNYNHNFMHGECLQDRLYVRTLICDIEISIRL